MENTHFRTLAPWGQLKTLKFFLTSSNYFEPIPRGNFFLLLHVKIPIFIFFTAPYSAALVSGRADDRFHPDSPCIRQLVT